MILSLKRHATAFYCVEGRDATQHSTRHYIDRDAAHHPTRHCVETGMLPNILQGTVEDRDAAHHPTTHCIEERDAAHHPTRHSTAPQEE